MLLDENNQVSFYLTNTAVVNKIHAVKCMCPDAHDSRFTDGLPTRSGIACLKRTMPD